MSVMMGFGAAQQGPGGGAPPAHAELMYGPPPPGSCGGLGSHPLSSVHDSGIEMCPHDMDPSTQEIEYHDASSSSDSRASFSDLVSSMSADDYSSESGGGPGIAIPTGTRGGPPMAMDKRPRARRRRSPPKATFDFNDNSLLSVYTFFKTFLGASTASTVAIDNKIEQAMDLVKSHLMFAVREEVDVLKDRIVELMDRIKHLECENTILRQYASPEVLQQIQSQLPHQLQQPPHHSSTS